MGICYLKNSVTMIGVREPVDVYCFEEIHYFVDIRFSSPAENSLINYGTLRLGRERGTMG